MFWWEMGRPFRGDGVNEGWCQIYLVLEKMVCSHVSARCEVYEVAELSFSSQSCMKQ